MALDFVLAEYKQPMIVEVSYCYNTKAVYCCPNQWDRNLNWQEGAMWLQDAILIDLLNDIDRSVSRVSSQGPDYR